MTICCKRDKKYNSTVKGSVATWGIAYRQYGDYPEVEAIKKLIVENPGISHVAMVHHETTTGILNPVKEVSQMAHQMGVEMVVDTVS